MIVLTSNGITSPDTVEKLKNIITKENNRAIIITTGSVEYKNEDKHVPIHISNFENLGFIVDLIDIEFENPMKLMNYDVVIINGGNPFYLIEKVISSGTDKILREIHDKGKIIIGISAGSVILGSSLSLIEHFDSELKNVCKEVFYNGLNLCNIDICPHYSRLITSYDQFENRLNALENRVGIKFVRLDDGDALFLSQ